MSQLRVEKDERGSFPQDRLEAEVAAFFFDDGLQPRALERQANDGADARVVFYHKDLFHRREYYRIFVLALCKESRGL